MVYPSRDSFEWILRRWMFVKKNTEEEVFDRNIFMPASVYERRMKPNEKLMVEYLFYLWRLKYVRSGIKKKKYVTLLHNFQKGRLRIFGIIFMLLVSDDVGEG